MSEFREGADQPPPMTRRELLVLLGANAALAASAAGCSRGTPEAIVPYVKQPPEFTPGTPTLYATTMTLGGYGTGLVVESHEGRPTKAEGNRLHPASLGGLGTFEQASVLSLYDPARGRELTREGMPSTWRLLLDEVAAAAPAAGNKKVHVLLEPASGPHLEPLLDRARRQGAVVHFDAPLSRRAAWQGTRMAFGQVLEPRWDFAQAEVVLALDADFLAAAGSPAAWARAWADRRRLSRASDAMSRLYVVEPRLTVTGISADERLRAQAREVRGVAAAVFGALQGGAPEEVKRAAADLAAPAAARAGYREWAQAVARDLSAHPGKGLVIAGDGQPPEVHALAHAMNEVLGNAGHAVTYGPSPVLEAGSDSHGLDPLLRAIDAGEVAALVIVGGDPVYTAAADQELGRRLGAVPVSAYVGLYENETSRSCRWFVPEAHFLETWGDARAIDGTASVGQPLMRPLGEGKTAGQVLAGLGGEPDAGARELVERAWEAPDAPDRWRKALVRGLAEDMAFAATKPAIDWKAIRAALASPATPAAELEIVFYADAKVHDGRFANNAWLQELGDPVTKLAWDNAALLSPATAARLGLSDQDAVDLEVRGRSVRAPALVVPGMADDVVALALGYGQKIEGRVSSGVGADAYAVRDSRSPWFDEATLRRTGGSWPLALTQEHASMEERPIVLCRTLAEYRAQPDFARPHNEKRPALYGLVPRGAHQWGMTIDLNACTGCSACVIACMAENNIPVVGKGGVRLGREMQWIRLDRYLGASPSDPAALVQPMLCQHCEKAPCEYVCPVNATVHSDDGLNEMVYNRCVGTRFCSNNCPYKVRRFNFFNYNTGEAATGTLSLAKNPDVTVRARGVMEKCSYCVQRIRETEIRARREERPIRDQEIQTACQQTCPTGAIVFGDIADAGTRVSESRKNDRLYAVLNHLGTLPRTRYLARVTNPNPEIRRS